jgi:hypothetical protein
LILLLRLLLLLLLLLTMQVGADLVVGLNGGVFPIGSGFYCGLGALGGGAPVAYSIVHGG